MPRGRPAAGKGVGGGRKKKSAVTEEEAEVGVGNVEDGSDLEDTVGEKGEEDVGEPLPAVPTSAQAVRKVLFVPKEIGKRGWENIHEVSMKHPRTGNKSLFLLDAAEAAQNLVYEVLTMQQETRSWFVDDSVISDGNVYVCTPVDSVFLVLPYLAKSDKAKPIADHLSESPLPRTVVDAFSKRLSYKQLENVTNKKEFDEIVAFVYSEEKTLAWLVKKAKKVADFLSSKGISHAESSISSNFTKSSVEVISTEDSLRYACDIVGEYIEESLKKKLLEKLDLPVIQEKSGTKRKGILEDENENSNKKTKMSDGELGIPVEDYGSATNSNTPANKNGKVTAREKGFQKAAQGSHSLFKFFTPKTK